MFKKNLNPFKQKNGLFLHGSWRSQIPFGPRTMKKGQIFMLLFFKYIVHMAHEGINIFPMILLLNIQTLSVTFSESSTLLTAVISWSETND